jgi:hypothetical protein
MWGGESRHRDPRGKTYLEKIFRPEFGSKAFIF